MDKEDLNPRWMKVLLGSGCGLFAFSLASFAYAGYFSRYLADDYCKSLYIRFYGFWNGQVQGWKILSGRFVTTFLTSVFELLGSFVIRLMPALVIILWVIGLSLFIQRASRFLPFRIPAAAAWLGGMVATLSSILGAPSRLQSLYWRDGMFNYSFPVVFFSLWLIIMTAQLEGQRSTWRSRRMRRLWLAAACAVLLAFLAGGCSETFAAFEIAFFLIAAGLVLLVGRGWLRRQALLLLGFSLAGALAALALNWLSPSTLNRQASFSPPPDLFTLLRLSLRYGYIFMRTSTDQMKLVTLMTAGIPALLVFYYAPEVAPGKWWRWLITVALIPLVGYALIVAVCAPSAYAETSYPEGRALMVGRFALVLTLMALGGAIGLWARGGLAAILDASQAKVPNGVGRTLSGLRPLHIAVLAVFAGLCLYSVAISWQINAKEIPPRQAWAAVWDLRDAQLRDAAAQGKTSLHVVELQSWETLFEIGPDPRHWVNICAAQFYGLKEIIATPP